VTQLAGWFQNMHGATAFQTLRFFGIAFLVIITLSGSIMTFSGEYHRSKVAALPVKRVAGSSIFWLLFLTLFTGLIAGFTVNTNMTKLYQGTHLQVGVMAVAFFAIMNALGRVTWGFLFDRMSAPAAIKMNLLSQAILFLAGPWLLKSSSGFIVFAIIAGFNYGGLLVNHASASARYWGPEHISQVYGWLSAANIPASLAPIFAGLVYDRCGNFTWPLIVIGTGLLVVIAFVHRKLPSAENVSRTRLVEGTEN
jgi:OFA family oxalate/formate antiporter-like MFS transporter